MPSSQRPPDPIDAARMARLDRPASYLSEIRAEQHKSAPLIAGPLPEEIAEQDPEIWEEQ